MNSCILLRIFLVLVLLFIMTYFLSLCKKYVKRKNYWCTDNIKMENNELKKSIKNFMCYYFDDTIKFKDFVFDNILLDKKSYEDILGDDILYKTLIGTKTLRIRFNNKYGFIRVYDRSRCLVLFGP